MTIHKLSHSHSSLHTAVRTVIESLTECLSLSLTLSYQSQRVSQTMSVSLSHTLSISDPLSENEGGCTTGRVDDPGTGPIVLSFLALAPVDVLVYPNRGPDGHGTVVKHN